MIASKLQVTLFLGFQFFVSQRATASLNIALIIIDMQAHFAKTHIKENSNKRVMDELLKRQVALIKKAKTAGIPIVLVETTPKTKGTSYPELTEAIGDYPNTEKIHKIHDGAFDGGGSKGAHYPADKLKTFLAQRKVTGLIVVGVNGGACVKCTIEGALHNDFKVWTDRSAIANVEHAQFKWPYLYEKGDLQLVDTTQVRHFFQTKPEILDKLIRASGSYQPTKADLECTYVAKNLTTAGILSFAPK